MKKLILLATLFTGITVFAQNKVAKGTLQVDGVCKMCKSRIEKACLTSKGVKSANWDLNTHELKVIYDDRKTNLEAINQTVANAGHDTKIVKAPNSAYDKIHACCKYRDEAIQDDHKNDKKEKHLHKEADGHNH